MERAHLGQAAADASAHPTRDDVAGQGGDYEAVGGRGRRVDKRGMKDEKFPMVFKVAQTIELTCTAFDCVHNLGHNHFIAGCFCDLKYIGLNNHHQCANYETEGTTNTHE